MSKQRVLSNDYNGVEREVIIISTKVIGPTTLKKINKDKYV
jgi:hypothetical protein